jgi:uncharacterized protein YcbK (DUF882 family)
MITLKELNPHNYPTNQFIDKNLAILLERMNELRDAYGKPMIVTSGLRSDEQQASLIAQGKSSARNSKHLAGAACDILDEHGELKQWVLNNVKILDKIGLWCEDFAHTPTWCHFQMMPPGSGKRFFTP